jgi:hypothetical protein
MSERVLHVYRTTEMAEYVVEDDQIYEDDTDMLRDVLEAAKANLLEFVPTEAEFVVMTWNEDSAITVRAAFPEGSAEAEVKTTREEAEYCPRCLEPQFRTTSGMVCRNGHGGLPGIGRVERAEKLEARRERQTIHGDVESNPRLETTRTTARRKPRRRNSR